mgnify:CR=1 FL=1
MTGTKAQFLAERARMQGRACLRFDYSGHGASGGRFVDGCIGDWLEKWSKETPEALAVAERAPSGDWRQFSWAQVRAAVDALRANPDPTEFRRALRRAYHPSSLS